MNIVVTTNLSTIYDSTDSTEIGRCLDGCCGAFVFLTGQIIAYLHWLGSWHPGAAGGEVDQPGNPSTDYRGR